MQLDRVPPPAHPAPTGTRPGSGELSGTATRPSGVWNGGTGRVRSWWLAARIWPRSGWRAWALVFAALSLLGQGERYRLDPRFDTPTATLLTYWEAVQRDDAQGVAECFAEPTRAVPYPGMVWEIPPARTLGLYSVRCERSGQNRVVATYEVRVTARDALDPQRLAISTVLVKLRGAWRIEDALGDMTSLDAGMPVRRVVDI